MVTAKKCIPVDGKMVISLKTNGFLKSFLILIY